MIVFPTTPASWHSCYATRLRLAWTAASIVLLAEMVIAVFVRQGDFALHIEFGQNFLHRQPYLAPGNFYLLPRLELDVLLTILGEKPTRIVSYLLAVASLAYCLKAWQILISDRFRLEKSSVLDATFFSIVIMLPFLLRDLDECGLQIFLLLMITLGAVAFSRGHKGTSGFWLAAAACYKVTPLLFLPFLIWKREWKTAAYMAVCFILLNLQPALWLGSEGMLNAHAKWFERISIASQHAEAYPSMGIYEQPKPQNVGLRALIARNLETYPKDHPLYVDHPLFVQFGALEAATAKRLALAIIFIIGGLIAWRFRHRWGASPHLSHMPSEWAVATLFCALMSPISWKQHLVLALPCVLIAVYGTLSLPTLPRWRVWTLIALALPVLLFRHWLWDRDTALVFMSYKTDTLALLACSLLVIFPPRTVGETLANKGTWYQPSRIE